MPKKRIKLTSEKISELIRRKRIYLDEDKTLEIFDDELVLNEKGKITKPDSAIITYQETETPENFMHALVCNHFNFSPCDVIRSKISIEEAIFRIRVSPVKELSLIVCPVTVAIKNTEQMFNDEILKLNKKKDKIGIYRRLGNSCYFFRWAEDV